jgi:hypothetical protein
VLLSDALAGEGEGEGEGNDAAEEGEVAWESDALALLVGLAQLAVGDSDEGNAVALEVALARGEEAAGE